MIVLRRSVLRVGVVLLLAFGAGHLVQNMQKNQRGVVAGPTIGGIEQVVAKGDLVIPGRKPASPAREPVAAPAAPADLPVPGAVPKRGPDDRSELDRSHPVPGKRALPHLAECPACPGQSPQGAV